MTKPCIVENMSGIIRHKEIQAKEEDFVYIYMYVKLISSCLTQVTSIFLKSHSTDSPFPKGLKFVSLLAAKDSFLLQKPSKLRIKRKKDIHLYMEENSKLSFATI